MPPHALPALAFFGFSQTYTYPAKKLVDILLWALIAPELAQQVSLSRQDLYFVLRKLLLKDLPLFAVFIADKA